MTPCHASLLRLSLVRLGIYMPHVRLLKKSPCCKNCVFSTHFKNQHKGRCSLWSPSEYQQLLCNSYSQAIQHADNESNLGRWAEVLEFRIPHLLFNRNPLLRMIRAASHIHTWSLSTPLHGHVIYVIFHVHLFCLHAGRTECALFQSLRKHWTTARSGFEDSPFYNMLLRTGIHQWTIATLQCTTCEITAYFLERAWWFKWRKWALNACTPAIPAATDTAAPPPQHSKRLGTVCADYTLPALTGISHKYIFYKRKWQLYPLGSTFLLFRLRLLTLQHMSSRQEGQCAHSRDALELFFVGRTHG